MAEVNPAGWLHNAGSTHTAAQLRTYAGALSGGGSFAAGTVTRMRGGVHPALGGLLAVTQNGTPNMSVNVASGVVFIPGTESAAQGVYFCENDATVNLTITTAPGGGNNRIDLVVAKVIDSFYSGASNAWSLAVVAGTPAVSPSPPTAPNNSIILAQVFVGSGVSSIVSGNITDVRIFSTGLGGLLSVGTTTERGTLIQYESSPIYRRDVDWVEISNGTAWNQVTPWKTSQKVTGSSVAKVTFSNIPTSLRVLTCTWTARGTSAVIASNLRAQVNNDNGTNYDNNFLQVNNSTLSGNVGVGVNVWQVGVCTAASAAANNFGSGELHIPGWNNPHSANLNCQYRSHVWESAANSWYQSGGGLYFAAGPFNRLDFFCDTGNIDVNSEFMLIGWS